MKKLLILLALSFLATTADARPVRFVQKLGSGNSFTPRQIPNLVRWLDARTPSTITIATGISVWADKSGSGNNATQAEVLNQPTYSGNDTITFNGSDSLEISGSAETYDIFAVFTTNTSEALFRSGFYCAPGQLPLILNTGTNNVGVFNASFQNSGLTWAANTRKRIRVRSNARAIQLAIDGAALTSVITTMTNSQITNIGNGPSAGQMFDKTHEILFYNRLLSDVEVAQVNKYLKNRWNVP